MIEGDPSLRLGANFLYTLTGKRPDDVMERAFGVALILHADHELNASTFAARVTAATLSDIYSAVTSAIGALKGPLHGGANEDVIKMLLAVGTPEKAVAKAQDMMARKSKIPGFGHRVYRTEDPRATHLRVMSEELGKRTGQEALYLMSKRVEETVRAEKKLNPNVDFYSASTYYSLGIPIDLFTPIFAVSRMAGWTAHILEQYTNNRLIRPRAEYLGKPDGQTWVPSKAARTMAIASGVSLEEYLRTEYEPDCDYVDGVLEDRNVGKKKHSRMQGRLVEILSPLAARYGLEPLPEQRLQVSPTRVRIPDVCLTPKADDSEVPREPPALCIEILSPDDRFNRLSKVIADYLAFGVPMIWIIDPYDREAFVVTQEDPVPQPCSELRWKDVTLQLE